jgi:hypothetical protein
LDGSTIALIAQVEFGDFAARPFRPAGRTVVAWRGDGHHVLCRLSESDEHEAQEAIRRGDGEALTDICRRAKRIQLATGEGERQ